ncbi:MAG: hypothetical protein E7554_08320 [Ruminococcaceae bacterium]|nr:hypothetical protein [Oscillospiraceae bacterium]
MRRHIKTLICILLLTLMIVPAAAFSAMAADGTTMTFDLKYHQSDARAMLKTINDYRKSQGQSELVYDYSLEKLAITRGEELIVSYGHARPNGDSSVYGVSENIAYNFDTASEVFAAFKNSDKGHNENMLDSRWQGVAVAHVEYGGRHYWVQLFTPSPSGAGETSAKNGTGTASVWVADGKSTVSGEPKCSTSALEIELDTTARVPEVTVDYTIPGHKPDGSVFTSSLPATWTSDNPEVAAVEGSTVKALKRGTANLTATVDGKTFTVPVTVIGTSIKNAVVELEYAEADFTGSELKPKVTSVKLGDETLTPYLDYSVLYSDNVEVGTATVTVVGKGEYSGQAVASFTIKGCAHKYDEGKVTKEATCKQEGAKQFTCSECGYVKTETISKLEHADADKNNKCDVCGLSLAAPQPTTAPSSDGGETTKPSTDDTTKKPDSTTKKTTKKTTKNTANIDNADGPNTGDYAEDKSTETTIILGVALLASFMFVAYLIKIVGIERRKTDKRRNSVRR